MWLRAAQYNPEGRRLGPQVLILLCVSLSIALQGATLSSEQYFTFTTATRSPTEATYNIWKAKKRK